MHYRFHISIIMFALVLGANAQIINSIHVESKTGQPVSEELVHENMELKVGSEFSRDTLNKDVKRLFDTGQFEDILPTTTLLPDDRIDILMILTLLPRITKITITGNRRVKTKKLRRLLILQEGDYLDNRALKEDLDSLIRHYRDKGYSDTRVKLDVKREEGAPDAEIEYTIKETQRVKVRRLDIMGNANFSSRKLKRKMETGVSFWGRIFPVGYYDATEFDEDLDALQAFYWGKGYLDFTIDDVNRIYNGRGTKIYITINVTEGETYNVGTVDITGNKAIHRDALTPLVQLKTGDLYDAGLENQDVDAISQHYQHRGYLESQIDKRHETDSDTHLVSVTYNIREGDPSSIRNIHISGNRVTKDYVIRRELIIQPGDRSDRNRIHQSRQRLLNLQYFESVDIFPISTEIEDLKDLQITVEEKPTGRLLFGAGFSTTDNIIGSVEVAQNNFDYRNYPSFRGGGQRFRSRVSLGASSSEFVIAFTEPWLFDRPLRLDLEVWNRSIGTNRAYDEKGTGFKAGLIRKLKVPFWRQSIGYRIEAIEISDIDNDYSARFRAAEDGSDTISALSLGFTRDHRDQIVYPSSGSLVNLFGELQSKVIGSYSNLYKLTARGEKYWPIFKKSVFVASGELTQINSVSGDDIRIFDRVFTGGANSIRGFRERDVGPVDPKNLEPVGGKSLMLAGGEFRTPIHEEVLFGALFVDAGNVWDGAGDWDVADVNVGAGAGIRIALPIGGIIRLDYGIPIRRTDDHLNTGGRIHFHISYNF